MAKMSRLVYVDEKSNKFAELKMITDTQLSLTQGRVGSTKVQEKIYPLIKWYTIYDQFIKKGYVDVTNERTIDQMVDPSKIEKIDDIANEKIKEIAKVLEEVDTKVSSEIKKEKIDKNDPNYDVIDILERLEKFTQKFVATHYKLFSTDNKKENLQMVKILQKTSLSVQHLLDEIQKTITNENFTATEEEVSNLNKTLLKIFTLIPRKMGRIKNNLIPTDMTDSNARINKIYQILDREQEILNNLVTGISTLNFNVGEVQEQTSEQKLKALLSKLGLEVKSKDDKLVEKVKEKLEDQINYYRNCWYVVNPKTEAEYEATKKELFGKKEILLWHGSKNENWLSILKTGLKIRPQGVSTTGAMFGTGIYFATKAVKSMGYTSLSGSRWARGNDSTGFLALFKVNIGKFTNTDSAHSFTLSELKKKQRDSVWAHKGNQLHMDEIIIYRNTQCTIFAIVELSYKDKS